MPLKSAMISFALSPLAPQFYGIKYKFFKESKSFKYSSSRVENKSAKLTDYGTSINGFSVPQETKQSQCTCIRIA